MVSAGFSFVAPTILLAFVSSARADVPPDTPTNLPPMPPGGVFNATARVAINASISTAWNILLDFPSYPEWNPFIRSQVVSDAFGVALDDQTPVENARLVIDCQIPPLPQPVNASTPANILHFASSFENITVIDTVNNRVAWQEIFIPAPLLNATHWQAFSTVTADDGTNYTLYENQEIYYGPFGYVIDPLYSEGLQEAFEAQAVTLKARAEAMEAAASS